MGEFVVSRMIHRLGDTSLYMRGTPIELFRNHGYRVFTDWVLLPRLIVSSVSSILHFRILVHLVFAMLAYYGIYKFLKAARTANTRMYYVLILMCFTPSFAIWSSLAGKEAFIVFSMGVICAEIIKFFKGEKVGFSVSLILAVYFITVIKFYYIPFLCVSLFYIFIRQHLRLQWYVDLLLLVLMFLCCIGVIYLYRYKIDNYAINKLHRIYSVSAKSTREPMFVQQFDFFRKMPVWIPISLWGPTLGECRLSVMHLCTFIESGFLFMVFIYMLHDVPIALYSHFRVFYQWLVLGMSSMMFVIFAQYVQGVMNSGAAIRYRTNIFIPLLCFAFAFTCVKDRMREKYEK
ncbi:MAG: hypothetical protein MJ215_00465 [Spirochaetia bacterium]|nr:hypothetical protein [Spirochaetia bacterium]